jgi:DNA-binding NarL/FixJ family response regulator
MAKRVRTIRVDVAENDTITREILRESISWMPGISCQYALQDGYWLAGRLDLMPWNPDIILLNYKLPPFDGIKMIETIKRLCPPAKIIIYTRERHDIEGIKLLGAPGVFEYHFSHPLWTEPSQLELEIKAVYNTPGSDAAPYRKKHWATYKEQYRSEKFTAKQHKFMELNAKMPSLLDIGEAMSLGRQEIDDILWTLYRQLMVMDRGDLAALAVRMGIVQIDDLSPGMNLTPISRY